MPADGTSMLSRSTSTVISVAGSVSMAVQIDSTVASGTMTGDEPVLRAVVAEDVAEARCDHGIEATLLDRPHGVLARRADAEARPGHQDRCADVPLVVEHEVAIVAPRREQTLLEAGALDPLQPLGGDDLVGVDVAAPQRHPATRDDVIRISSSLLRDLPEWRSGRRLRSRRRWRGRPGGCGRRGPGGPRSCGCWCWPSARPAPTCRGSSPGTCCSPARASRRRPARNTSCRPSASACDFTAWLPGTIITRFAVTVRPFNTRRRRGDPRCDRWCNCR